MGRPHHLAVDELLVIPDKTQETGQGTCCARLWPGLHRSHLLRIHGDALGRDDVAKVRHPGLAKEAHGKVMMATHLLHHNLDMCECSAHEELYTRIS